MPVVPFTEQRVGMARQEGGIRTERAPVASTGAGLEQLGRGVAAAGGAVTELAQQQAKKHQQVQILSQTTPMSEEMAKRTADFRSLGGVNANDEAKKQFEEDLVKIRKKYGTGLEGDAAALFNQHADRTMSAHRVDAHSHVVGQQKIAAEETRKSAVGTGVGIFVGLGGKGEAAQQALTEAMGAAWDPTASRDVNVANIQNVVGRAVAEVIGQQLSQPNPDVDAAKALFVEKKEAIPPAMHQKIRDAIAEGERKKEDNLYVADTVRAVQAELPVQLDKPDPSVFTRQEMEAEKRIEEEFVSGKLTRERRDARLAGVRAVIGDARTTSLRKIQDDERTWMPQLMAVRSGAERLAVISKAPEYLRPELTRIHEQQNAREDNKPTHITDKVEIDKRVSLITDLMRTRVREGDVGAYSNEVAVEADARRLKLPEEEIVKLKKLFRGRGAEIVPGVTTTRIEEALAESLGKKRTDLKSDQVNTIFMNVSEAWPEGKEYDPVTLNKLVKAQLMKVRTSGGSMRAYEALAQGLEGSMEITDEEVLRDERKDAHERYLNFYKQYQEEKDPKRAKELLQLAFDATPEPVNTQLESLEKSEFEREKAFVMSYRLGLIPGHSREVSRRTKEQSIRSRIDSLAAAAVIEAEDALQATKERVETILGIEQPKVEPE